MQEYERASVLEPSNPIFDVKLAQVKRVMSSSKTGQERTALLKEAEDLLNKAIAKKKNFSVAYLSLGLTQEAAGNKNGAFTNVQKAIDTDSKNIEAKFQLARLYRVRGDEDLKKSEALLKSSIEQNN